MNMLSHATGAPVADNQNILTAGPSGPSGPSGPTVSLRSIWPAGDGSVRALSLLQGA
jgi:hypothetical protein